MGLAKALAGQFTVFAYDRRGRGDSGDSPAYSPQREIEDLEAVIDAAGGHVYLYGVSSGAVLALEAACALPGKVDKLVIYEPPVVVDDTRPPVPADAPEQLARLVAEGKRGTAVDLFLRDYCQTPGAFVTIMKALPPWRKLKATAHTLPYDETILSGLQQGKPLPTGRWASLAAPTLVISGGKSPAWLRNGPLAVSETLGSEYKVLPGQTHVVSGKKLAPMLASYLTGALSDGGRSPDRSAKHDSAGRLNTVSSRYAALIHDDDAGHLRRQAAALTTAWPSRSQTPGPVSRLPDSQGPEPRSTRESSSQPRPP